MRAQCLCTRHAGETPAPPGGAGVMGCIAVCGRNACAPGMRAGSPRTQVGRIAEAGWKPALPACGRDARAPSMRTRRLRTQAGRIAEAGWKSALPACGLDARAPRWGVSLRQAGSPRSRHAGWTPAHPRGISPEAGWKPAYPGGVSLYAGETPALPACGLDACAPMRCRGEGAHRCMRARRPRSRHASWKPAPPACELKARAPRHAGWKPAHPGGDVLWGDRFRLW